MLCFIVWHQEKGGWVVRIRKGKNHFMQWAPSLRDDLGNDAYLFETAEQAKNNFMAAKIKRTILEHNPFDLKPLQCMLIKYRFII